jgi:hypothetical protein
MFSRSTVMKLVLVIGMLLSAAAGAQGWNGFYVDGAIGARSSSTTTTMTSTVSQSFPLYWGGTALTSWTDTSEEDLSHTNFLGEFSAGYRFSIAEKVIVGVGAFVDAAASGAGESSSTSRYSSSYPGYISSSGSSDRTTLEQTSRYGLSLDVAPNWRTHPYAKVTYAWSSYKLSSSGLDCPTGGSPGAWSSSATVSGLGFGGGLRHLQTDNLYFFAEVMWQGYGAKNNNLTSLCPSTTSPYQTVISNTSVNIDPSNVVGVVGMGWKF